MRKILWLMLLLISVSGFSQNKNTPLTLFKAAIKLENGETSNRILYEVKKDEIILIDDSPGILSQIRENKVQKFYSIFADDLKSIRIRKKNYYFNYLGKSILIGTAAGFLIGSTSTLGSDGTNPYQDLALIGGSIYGGFLGLITSPIVFFFPRKSYNKADLKDGFPKEELKIFTVKWQLENRKSLDN